jgi:Xaa-Pro aminopeptidase
LEITTSYKQRRTDLLTYLQGGLGIIRAGKHMTRSNDTEFPFRQDSIFKYLTGFSEQESILVLTPANEKKFHLFVRPKDELLELWAGKRMGVKKAKSLLDMDEVYSINDFNEKIVDLLPGHDAIYCDLFGENNFVQELLVHVKTTLSKYRKSPVLAPHRLGDIRHFTKQMRLVKDANEIQFMKRAAQITSKAHIAAMAKAAAGVNESEIAALIEYLFKKQGAPSAAYESIVAGGDNANTLHYISNNQVLNGGDLLLIDAGAEFNLYASDVTRTFPIDGKFSGIQKEVYQLVLESQKSCINMSLPGKSLTEIHNESCKILTQGLIDLKVLTGSLDENITNSHYKKYYPHGTSHWLGMDVHDECHYYSETQQDVQLAEGMIFTIEPGLYFPSCDKSIRKELQGIGIRIEDDILITKTGHEIITSQIPKEIKEIEEACKQDFQDLHY